MTAAALGTEVLVATLEADLRRHRRRRPRRSGWRCRRAPSRAPGSPSTARACRGCAASGRGQLGVTLLVQTPTRIDDEQRELLRQLAELREETRPEVSVQKHGRGMFGRLRDAFAGQ